MGAERVRHDLVTEQQMSGLFVATSPALAVADLLAVVANTLREKGLCALLCCYKQTSHHFRLLLMLSVLSDLDSHTGGTGLPLNRDCMTWSSSEWSNRVLSGYTESLGSKRDTLLGVSKQDSELKE